MTARIKYFVNGIVALSLASCATPQSRIRNGLIEFGVPEQPARCIAGELGQKLPGDKLAAVADLISGARAAPRASANKANIHRALDIIARAADPQIASVSLRVGIACTVLGE